MYVCMYIYIYMYVQTHICTYIYICIYICAYSDITLHYITLHYLYTVFCALSLVLYCKCKYMYIYIYIDILYLYTYIHVTIIFAILSSHAISSSIFMIATVLYIQSSILYDSTFNYNVTPRSILFDSVTAIQVFNVYVYHDFI